MSNYRSITLEEAAKRFKALSNPNRLKIFMRLFDCCGPGSICSITTPDESRTTVGDLGSQVEVVPSTVSHHLKELHQAGLIQMERQGQRVLCWVDPETLESLADYFKFKQK